MTDTRPFVAPPGEGEVRAHRGKPHVHRQDPDDVEDLPDAVVSGQRQGDDQHVDLRLAGEGDQLLNGAQLGHADDDRRRPFVVAVVEDAADRDVAVRVVREAADEPGRLVSAADDHGAALRQPAVDQPTGGRRYQRPARRRHERGREKGGSSGPSPREHPAPATAAAVPESSIKPLQNLRRLARRYRPAAARAATVAKAEIAAQAAAGAASMAGSAERNSANHKASATATASKAAATRATVPGATAGRFSLLATRAAASVSPAAARGTRACSTT
jgi:hypothetical protein